MSATRTQADILADMRELRTRKPVVYAVSMLAAQGYRPKGEDADYLKQAADLLRELVGSCEPQSVVLTVHDAYSPHAEIGSLYFVR